jgi:hypothetical protein
MGESTTRSRVVASRLQRTYALAIIPTSPTPTVSTEADESQSPEERDGSADFWGGADEDIKVSTEGGSQGSEEGSEGFDSDGEASMDGSEAEFPVFSSDVELPSITQVFEQWRQEKLASRRSG